MKYNIPGDKNTSRMQIKEFISFDVIRITYENTLPSPRIKLRSMGSNGRSKTQASKNFEKRIRGGFLMQEFKWGFVFEKMRWKPID